jgi:general secretion pathway protein F
MRFAYTGTDPQGRPVSGEVDASGLVEAAHRLASGGVEVASMSAVEATASEPALKEVDAFVFFNRALSQMTRAGLPLPAAIGAIARSAGRGPMAEALRRVEAALRAGTTLEAALDAESSVFPAPYRQLVRAGAAAGNLPAVLAAAASHASTTLALRRGVASALVYPLLALVTCWGVAAFLAVAAMPLYRGLYAGFHQKVPGWLAPAEMLMRTPLTPIVVLAVAGLVIVGGLWTLRRTARGESLLWRLPLAGRIARAICAARALGALRVALAARSPLASALPAALAACGSVRWTRAAESAAARLRDGAGIADALGALPGWSPRLARSLGAAEKRGRLEEAVRDAAERAAEEAEQATAAFVAAAEPAALVGIGVLVGLMMIAIVSPYFGWLSRMTG